MTNPWNLTETEARVIAAVCESGSDKLSAQKLDMSPRTLEVHMHAVRFKMGVPNRVLAALKWDRRQRALT